jgi:asparaginyl-tRNA synthetase
MDWRRYIHLWESRSWKLIPSSQETLLEFFAWNCNRRCRSNNFGAVFGFACLWLLRYTYILTRKGFYYLHTHIITASELKEPAVVKVTTLDALTPPLPKPEPSTIRKFFSDKTHKTWLYWAAWGRIGGHSTTGRYILSPTFRADNSILPQASREFWMIEPEMEFYDRNDN